MPHSLTINYPPKSRVVNGRRHNLATTPRTCPASRRWTFGDTHTFADGSKDVFVNHVRCIRPKPKPGKPKRHRHRSHGGQGEDRD